MYIGCNHHWIVALFLHTSCTIFECHIELSLWKSYPTNCLNISFLKNKRNNFIFWNFFNFVRPMIFSHVFQPITSHSLIPISPILLQCQIYFYFIDITAENGDKEKLTNDGSDAKRTIQLDKPSESNFSPKLSTFSNRKLFIWRCATGLAQKFLVIHL